jgi:hypothetical protein
VSLYLTKSITAVSGQSISIVTLLASVTLKDSVSAFLNRCTGLTGIFTYIAVLNLTIDAARTYYISCIAGLCSLNPAVSALNNRNTGNTRNRTLVIGALITAVCTAAVIVICITVVTNLSGLKLAVTAHN